jgi:hypothetical protein
MRAMKRLMVLLVVCAGCSQRLGDLSAMSNRNLNTPVAKGQRAQGEDCAWNILGIPTGVPNLEDATDDAMRTDPQADVLVDVVIRSSAWWFLIGKQCVTVEGTLARTTAATAAPAP